MAYLRPNTFERIVFNRLAMRLGISGAKTLTVVGRKSGQPRSVPVVLATHEGSRYLVCPRGEAEWVKNLRAVGGKCELTTKGKTEALLATEIPVADREPIIAAYRKVAASAVNGYFKKLPDAKDHPTFRLEARS